MRSHSPSGPSNAAYGSFDSSSLSPRPLSYKRLDPFSKGAQASKASARLWLFEIEGDKEHQDRDAQGSCDRPRKAGVPDKNSEGGDEESATQEIEKARCSASKGGCPHSRELPTPPAAAHLAGYRHRGRNRKGRHPPRITEP